MRRKSRVWVALGCILSAVWVLCGACEPWDTEWPLTEEDETVQQSGPPPAQEPAEPSELEPKPKPVLPLEEPAAEEAAPLEWHRPRFTEREAERHNMVKEQIVGPRWGGAVAVDNEDVLEAMRQVPRHRFVPERPQELAYDDRPLPIGYGQTISQPYIVALMTQALDVQPGDKVLEIGTGSGYQAAVLSELTPHVYSVEILRALADPASERLKTLGYETVEAKWADGYYGWPEHSPFDGIIVTCAAGHVPPPLVNQLKPGGRMVIPIGDVMSVQRLVLVLKGENGELTTRDMLSVRFVPMTGAAESR